ncbi:hypothetical protein [Flavobacterium defluvii]|uniref:Uncharacterized protein n=1 Tax=Flavobacterium defluvii TaxID=370979 RepID=A0A1M5N8J4_9FLAO|nr:hypothetical protein [Flavobacterium defluvii]SHG85860.1 hypothetical protein SAMN05443663_104117 [Flavobacterium defluvii]
MMKVNYKNFEIELLDDPNYSLNSADNFRQYKKVYFQEKRQENCFYPESKHVIIIKEFGIEISSSIICEVGWAMNVTEDSFIIEEDKIWIIGCSEIYCLEIPTLELIWQKDYNSFALFSIHKLDDDFVIHGELEILRITKEGEIIWSFGGRDIWVTIDGKNVFTIENKSIRLFDFESNEYVIDFDGKQIEDNPRIISPEIKNK